MKILVTGGNGFIGAKLVELLCNKHSVTILDNNDTYGLMSQDELQKLIKWRQRNWSKVNHVFGDVRSQMSGLKALSHVPTL